MEKSRKRAPLETQKAQEPEKSELRKIMEMPPREMAEFFVGLEEKGELRTFLEDAMDNDAFSAYISYYQKWIELGISDGNQKLIDDIVQTKRELYPAGPDTLPLDLEKKYTPEEIRRILANVKAIQFTFGCYGCDFCGFDAPKGVRESIPYNQVCNLFEQYHDALNRGLNGSNRTFLPYGASDIFLYRYGQGEEKKLGQDILELMHAYFPERKIHITTRSLPTKGKEKHLKQASNPVISLFGLSDEEKVAKKIKFQHFGDIQFQGEQGEPWKLGTSFTEEEFARSIASENGMNLTSRGLYNILRIGKATEQYPQGHIVVPFEGFKPESENLEIQAGENIRDFLPYGLILDTYGEKTFNRRDDKGVSGVFFLFKNNIYQIEIDNDGKIKLLKEFDRENLSSQNELPKMYGHRINACLLAEPEPEAQKKIGRLIIKEMVTGQLSDSVNFSKGFKGYLLKECFNTGFLKEEEVKELLKHILKNTRYADQREDNLLALTLLSSLAESHPEALEDFFTDCYNENLLIERDYLEEFMRFRPYEDLTFQIKWPLLLWAVDRKKLSDNDINMVESAVHRANAVDPEMKKRAQLAIEKNYK